MPTFAKKYQKDKTAEPQNLIANPDQISEIALQFFTNEDLFIAVVSNGYSVIDYAKALAHLSYGNSDLSKEICKMAIECRYLAHRHSELYILRQ